MRMRQSLAQLERAFVEETHLDRQRRESLRRDAAARSRRRHVRRETERSSMRFGVLTLTLVLTAVVVAIAMFKTLYLVIG